MVELHKQAPEFSLQDQNGVTHTLEMHKGKKVVLYFYPKDDTPGCTVEACSFRDAYNDLQNKNVMVFGISKDSVKSHDKFAKKYELPFPLLSDSDGSICEAYGVWRKKKFMGREYIGIERMSFLIDEKGNIEKIYEKVKPKEHVDEVKGDVSSI